MGVQYIFVVETNSKCKSDWIYIRDRTILSMESTANQT